MYWHVHLGTTASVFVFQLLLGVFCGGKCLTLVFGVMVNLPRLSFATSVNSLSSVSNVVMLVDVRPVSHVSIFRDTEGYAEFIDFA